MSLRFTLHQTAGRATLTRFLGALAKVQKKMLLRCHPSGLIEFAQQPDVTNRIAHIWVSSNTEIFGFDEYQSGGVIAIELTQVRALHTVLVASEAVEGLRVEWSSAQPSRLLISSQTEDEDEMFFGAIQHELPVKHIPEAESYFREPLIPRPAITFTLPQPTALLHDKLGRLSRHAETILMAANHSGRFVCTTTGTAQMLQAELSSTGLQVIGPAPTDPYELQQIGLSLASLTRVLACLSTLQAPVLTAIAPNDSAVFSAKLANPCGPDRPAGALTLILAAHST